MSQHYNSNVKKSDDLRWTFTVIRCIPIVIAAVAIVLALTGCGAQPIKADPLPTVVKVPVLVPCLDRPTDKPVFKTDAEILDGSDYQVVVNLRIDRDTRRMYEAALEANEQACIKSVEQTK